ncbi:MAG: FAD-binding protein [Firmicutes bacterium]|nr:FAD-binding protein [Bacillota bacterium]
MGGALTADLSGYQGHGSVATPHGVLITWALMMQGAIQVNARGERFANEHDGYSEAAVRVLRQPGKLAAAACLHRLPRLSAADLRTSGIIRTHLAGFPVSTLVPPAGMIKCW